MASLTSPAHAKKLRLSDNTTYGYVHIPASSSQPTYLLLHGYPATSYEWRHQIASLSGAGFGVLAPDCLGYGDTDRPTEIEAYNLKRLSGHIAEILDAEGLERVIGVGHDWGSGVLSNTAFHHPRRFSRLVFVNVGYTLPGKLLDVDEINAASWEGLGYPLFGYWYFFNSPDAAALIEANLASVFALAYTADKSKNLAPIAAARRYLSSGRTESLPSWLSPEERDTWIRIFQGSHVGPLNYYKGIMRGITTAGVDDTGYEPERNNLKVPVLFVGGTRDAVCPPEQQAAATKAYATAGFKDVRMDTEHWPMLEKREEFGRILEDFGRES